MAVTSVNEIGDRWAQGVQNKQNKFQRAFDRSRDDVLEGLRQIGLSPGPNYSSAVTGASAAQAAEAWAQGVSGKRDKMVQNFREAIES